VCLGAFVAILSGLSGLGLRRGSIMKTLLRKFYDYCSYNHILLFGVIGMVLLAGCSNIQIKEDLRIPLVKDVRQTGTYEDFDYIIDYRYVYKQESLQQPGEIDLTFGMRRKRALYSLTVWVNFLDPEGLILEKKVIFGLGNRTGKGVSHKGPLQTPPGTVAIAFTSTARDFKSRQ